QEDVLVAVAAPAGRVGQVGHEQDAGTLGRHAGSSAVVVTRSYEPVAPAGHRGQHSVPCRVCTECHVRFSNATFPFMSSSSAAPGRDDRAGRPGRPPTRDALIAAAFRPFLARGYEEATVDDIVALAGVGRRSFFRYFPSKEDVVFPDHERCLADMTAFLEASTDEDDPVRRVCDAARLVLRMYAEKPEFSVQRYRLTKRVPVLRAYELSVVWRYQRALAG